MSDKPDLSAFDVETGSNQGAKLELLDKNGSKTGLWIRLVGADSTDYQRVVTQQNRKRLNRLQRPQGPKMTTEDMDNERFDRLVACTKEWNLKLGGQDYPCTPENAEKIYRASTLITEQVEAFVNERANFIQP